MNDSAPRELELTAELLEYAHGVAMHEAQEHCPPFVDFGDVAQEAVLHLMSKTIKYDPSKGASEKTLIYTVVQRFVLKYNARQCRHASRFKQVVKPQTGDDDDREAALADFSLLEEKKRHPRELRTKRETTEDILEYIDDPQSRELCQVVIDCGGNMSEAARRLGISEGTVRYRFKMLAPKLLAAGFEPFPN